VNVLKGKLWNDKSKFDDSKDKSTFRDYKSACDRVKNFYREQHRALPSFRLPQSSLIYSTEKQTVDFNLEARAAFKERQRVYMSVWEAMELLNTFVDESDPDVRPHLPP
jgi:inositol oxygenase